MRDHMQVKVDPFLEKQSVDERVPFILESFGIHFAVGSFSPCL